MPPDDAPPLIDLTLKFFGKGDASHWSRYADEGRFDVEDDPDCEFPGARFVGLPHEVTPGSRYITGSFHAARSKDANEKGDAHWHLNVYVSPASPAPTDMVARSERVGGIEGILVTIARLWPGDPSIEVEAEATFDCSKATLSPPLAVTLPWEPTTFVDDEGVARTATLDVVAFRWTVKPRLVCADRITLSMINSKYATANVRGTFQAQVGPRMLAFAEEELWRSLMMFKTS